MSQLEILLQRCTVKLTLPGGVGWGTGFFVAPKLILTCAHVVQQAQGKSLQVRWQNEENWAQAMVEQIQPDPYDLALLRIMSPTDTTPPCVCLDGEIQSRDPLYLFGYPDQDFPNGCPATFNCEGLTGDEPPLIKFALGQVRPGMSGSPLLNQRTGKVCGIVKFTRDRTIDLGGGAVSSSTIVEKFPQIELEYEQNNLGSQLTRESKLFATSEISDRFSRRNALIIIGSAAISTSSALSWNSQILEISSEISNHSRNKSYNIERAKLYLSQYFMRVKVKQSHLICNGLKEDLFDSQFANLIFEVVSTNDNLTGTTVKLRKMNNLLSGLHKYPVILLLYTNSQKSPAEPDYFLSLHEWAVSHVSSLSDDSDTFIPLKDFRPIDRNTFSLSDSIKNEILRIDPFRKHTYQITGKFSHEQILLDFPFFVRNWEQPLSHPTFRRLTNN